MPNLGTVIPATGTEFGVMTQRGYPPPDQDWWRSEQGKGMCKECHEERLISFVTDRRGTQAYCPVCNRSWWTVLTTVEG